MPAQITLEVAAAPVALPSLDAPLGLQHDLDNDAGAGGWTDVDFVSWTLRPPPGSSATLSVASPIVGAPFTNDFTPDVPGSYMVHLHITYITGATVSTDRALISVVDPCSQVALPGNNELGADFDDPSPTPTRSAVDGWFVADSEARDRALLALKYGGSVVRVINETGGPLVVDTVVKPVDDAIFKGGAGGIAVAFADRRFVMSVDVVDGTVVADVGAATPLFLLLGNVADGDYGLALAEGMAIRDTNAENVDVLYAVDDTGVLLYVPDITRIYRVVARVGRQALDTADPPGWIYFTGRPPGLLFKAGAMETDRFVQTQDVGAPVWSLLDNTAGGIPAEAIPHRLTCNAANDVGRHIQLYRLLTSMGMWSSQDMLFRLTARAADVSETVFHLKIEDHWGAAILDTDLPIGGGTWPALNDTWDYYDIDRTDLAFGAGGVNIEPALITEQFLITVAVTFSAIAGGGETADFGPLQCGRPGPISP